MTTALIQRISERVGLPVHDVAYIVATAPRRYKEFQIPKRSGRGWRNVAQPSRELKLVQRFVVDELICDLPVHSVAHGYVRAKGIKTNASTHISSSFFLKMDFVDFFPSLKPRDLDAHLSVHAPDRFTEDEFRQLARLVFWTPKRTTGLRLCIGAPSSPFLSNTLMYALDLKIDEVSRERGVSYTRYADDLTFSANEKGVLGSLQQEVTKIVRASRSPLLRINDDKTIHMSRAQRVFITGITLSAQESLSIGRERKRKIRAMVHRSSLGQLSRKQEQELAGLLAFARDIEPRFVAAMAKRMSKARGSAGD